MKKFILALAIHSIATSTWAQSLADAMKPSTWNTYIFVSTKMPRESLVALAKESIQAKATLVFNGYSEGPNGLSEWRKYVDGINTSCCKNQPVSWMIHPKLFERYTIKTSPTFVLAYGEDRNPNTFVSVSGDMNLANALKFFAQESKVPALSRQAASLYGKVYATP